MSAKMLSYFYEKNMVEDKDTFLDLGKPSNYQT